MWRNSPRTVNNEAINDFIGFGISQTVYFDDLETTWSQSASVLRVGRLSDDVKRSLHLSRKNVTMELREEASKPPHHLSLCKDNLEEAKAHLTFLFIIAFIIVYI